MDYPGYQTAQTLWSALATDHAGGFGGAAQRSKIHLFSPTGGPGTCGGGNLIAVDTVTLLPVLINGLPTDTCDIRAAGWGPAGLGSITTAGGNAAVEIDATTKQVYLLTPLQDTGTYTNLLSLTGYPFF
jgi:hypothetical protein